jgi:L-rhamnose mutarotase
VKTHRQLFRAKYPASQKVNLLEKLSKEEDSIRSTLKTSGVHFAKLFSFENQLFIYLESESLISHLSLGGHFDAHLESWPGLEAPRKWVEMLDIFHDSKPRGDEPWRDFSASRKSIGSIIYLRPEKYASYVFYHFQLQEEGIKKFNKYYLIGAHETCLFSYQEQPAVIDTRHEDRVLNTNLSPDNWAELMGEHFQPWPEGLNIADPWKVMEEVFSFSNPIS